MPSPARQFEPHITRSGGVPSKFRFTVRCSRCPKTDNYDVGNRVDDRVVKYYFRERGWLLGRDRAYDLCPGCLGVARDAQPGSGSNGGHHRLEPTAKQLDQTTVPADKRHRETADILARHLGKSETLAAEVFRPREPQIPRPTQQDVPRQFASAPLLSPAAERALIEMASDLKSLRSTMEALTEQVSKLVGIGGQQVEAVARMAPLMIQAADGIATGLRDVISTPRTIPDHSAAEEQQRLLTEELAKGPGQETRSEWQPVSAGEASELPRHVRRRRKSDGTARQRASGRISVKSIPDAKRADRFYTTIRVPRELWDRAGFAADDRLQIDWDGKTLSIIRVADGGVKPKSIGDAVVVLQSWRLGDLTFEQAKITTGDRVLRVGVRS